MATHTILFAASEPTEVLLFARALQQREPTFGVMHLTDGQRVVDYLSKVIGPAVSPPQALPSAVGPGRTGMSALPEGASAPQALPSLVVLDIDLPERNGVEVLRWAREQPALRELPIIVLTGAGRADQEKVVFDLGATTHVTRSRDWSKLLDNIQHILKQRVGSNS